MFRVTGDLENDIDYKIVDFEWGVGSEPDP